MWLRLACVRLLGCGKNLAYICDSFSVNCSKQMLWNLHPPLTKILTWLPNGSFFYLLHGSSHQTLPVVALSRRVTLVMHYYSPLSNNKVGFKYDLYLGMSFYRKLEHRFSNALQRNFLAELMSSEVTLSGGIRDGRYKPASEKAEAL